MARNRVVRRLRKALLPLRRAVLGDRYVARVDGRPMVVNLSDRGFTARLFWRDAHEIGGMRIVRSLVRPGMTVVDVGAHIGFYAVECSVLVGPAGRVHAFEPDPDNRALLEENLAANACANVTVVPQALSDAEGVLTLHRSKYNSGDHRIYDATEDDAFHRGGARERVEIAVTTLDRHVREQGLTVDFVKADVQGAEARLFAGMQETLRRTPHIRLMIEFWPHGIRSAGDDPDALLANITDLGFGLYEVRRDGLTARRPEELVASLDGDRHVNLLLSRTLP